MGKDPLGSGVSEGHAHDDDSVRVVAPDGVDGDVSLLRTAGGPLGRAGTDVEIGGRWARDEYGVDRTEQSALTEAALSDEPARACP